MSSAVVDVTVPTRSGRVRRGAMVLHRSATLRREDVLRHCGIPVTSPARTLLDLGDYLPESGLERALERAEARRLFDLRALREVLTAAPTRPGAPMLRRILERHTEPALTRSVLEDRFLELCAARGLPRPEVNERVGPYEVDFLWRRESLIVETDGRGAHATRAAFERDRARDADLTAAGYRVVRFTHRQVTAEPGAVATRLRSLLSGTGR